MKAHRTGVLATTSESGQPHASAVYYVCDDDFNIYFFTLLNSRKRAAMSQNPKVAFTVGAQDVPQTMQIEGVAVELRDTEELSAHVEALTEVLTSNSTYYAPIMLLDRSELILVWIKPSWIRWADYTSADAGNKNVLFEIPLA